MPLLNVTNEEAALLRRVLDQFPQTAGNPRIRQDTERSYDDRQDFQAPEVYIALPPEGGITGLTRVGTAVEAGEGDMPGSAECDVFQVVAGALVPVSGLKRTVLNLSTTNIGRDWIAVTRTKFGVWVASNQNSEEPGTGCVDTINGVSLLALTNSLSATHALGITADGCLVKIPISDCDATGTA